MRITDDLVEIATKAYAESTRYYVPYHKGLSSESADKMRSGIRAALTAAAKAESKQRRSLIRFFRSGKNGE